MAQRELIEAQREAFVKGANWRLDLHNASSCACGHGSQWPGMCILEAANRYPLTEKKPRVFESESYRYRVANGVVEYQYKKTEVPDEWYVDGHYYPRVILALADLLANPTEDVPL